FGPKKLNDAGKVESALQRMIQLDPGEPSHYFQLARLYEDAGVYAEAEKVLQRARQAKPGDPAVYVTLAGFYNRQHNFEKTIEALQERAKREPDNPESFYTIAAYYWDEAYKNLKLQDADKRSLIGKGLEAVDRALQM